MFCVIPETVKSSQLTKYTNIICIFCILKFIHFFFKYLYIFLGEGPNSKYVYCNISVNILNLSCGIRLKIRQKQNLLRPHIRLKVFISQLF